MRRLSCSGCVGSLQKVTTHKLLESPRRGHPSVAVAALRLSTPISLVYQEQLTCIFPRLCILLAFLKVSNKKGITKTLVTYSPSRSLNVLRTCPSSLRSSNEAQGGAGPALGGSVWKAVDPVRRLRKYSKTSFGSYTVATFP